MSWYFACANLYQSAMPTAEAYAHSHGYRRFGHSGDIVDEPNLLGGCTVRIGFTDPDKTENNRIEITLRRNVMFGGWRVQKHTITHFDWREYGHLRP